MESDDPDLGPLFPETRRYSTVQLQAFSQKLTELRYWYTEEQSKLKTENHYAYVAYRNILFDSKIVRAHLLLRRYPNSKRLLLRLLQRFLDCLDESNAYIDISNWFLIQPVETQSPEQAPTVASPSTRPFDPSKPSTSTGKQ